ncbi:calcium-binding protein [Enterovirga aerilata]|uniref:Calcium-binding protein n=1 Tax=Enterovirga aerilata TaxID=2730920 RepID=A0A849ICZ2_9HYPH|nr:calcium-binding protein [Enterovirga sp. DB1703]NNM73910.1 calcium-binding protein [Enterovirga sp. DB1703]
MARRDRFPTDTSHDRFDGPDDGVADFYLDHLGGLRFGFEQTRVAVAGGSSDRLKGTAQDDHLWGRGGDDQIAGGGGDDVLYGQDGKDILTGGVGADRLVGGAGDDQLFGGADADALMGGDGDDFLDEGAGHGDLEGGAGNDILVGGQGPDAFGFERGSGDDVVRDFTAGPGMFDHLALRGLTWEDLSFEDINAGVKVRWDGGSVLLEGVARTSLAQDDFMFADQPDLPPGVREPAGPAPERPSASSDGPALGYSTLGPVQGTFDAVAKVLLTDGDLAFDFDEFGVAVGSGRADVIRGGAADDNLFGRGGDDHLIVAAGDDILEGGAGRDLLEGGDGADRLMGGAGNDKLVGGAMVDELMGGDGRDYLDAGAGHDMIEGGRGDDGTRGGSGADAFIVDRTSGNDLVFDFEALGEAQGAFDHIALRDISPGDITVSDGTRTWEGQSYSGALVSWDVNHDGTADGSVLLSGVASSDLRQSDFMFVDEPGFVAGVSDVGSYFTFA